MGNGKRKILYCSIKANYDVMRMVLKDGDLVEACPVNERKRVIVPGWMPIKG
jgi:hypothetical protein